MAGCVSRQTSQNPRVQLHRAFRYRLFPETAQEALFRQFAGVCRLVYNLALEQRRDWWRQYRATTGRLLSTVSQSRELTDLRGEFDWIAAVSVTCQQQALRDLDKAYANFFAGRTGYPTPRRRGVNDAFRFQGRELQIRRLNAKWSAVRLPKIGWVKFRDTRAIEGVICNATVRRDPLGWRITFACEIEREEVASAAAHVGIDRGVANTLALSNGERLSVPASLSHVDREKRRAQKAMARRMRGSARHAKAKHRVAKMASRAARIRNDWHHRATRSIADRFGTVVVENLKIGNMTATARGTVAEPGRNVRQKAGLNRSILNQGWGVFVTLLAYKLEERGGTLIKINPAYTSQTCSDCGAVDSRSRENQASFACRHCGFRAHADHNAAINILRRNTSSMGMEEGHLLSDEVPTGTGFRPPKTIAPSA